MRSFESVCFFIFFSFYKISCFDQTKIFSGPNIFRLLFLSLSSDGDSDLNLNQSINIDFIKEEKEVNTKEKRAELLLGSPFGDQRTAL